MKKLIPLFLFIVIYAGCSDKPTSPYVISQSIKLNGVAKLDVQLYARLTKPELVAIASKIKKDSSQYNNLQLDYLLPGNSSHNMGGVTVYATAIYHDPIKVTAADTVTDLHDNRLSFEFNGFAPQEAKKLMAFNPTGMEGKTLVGKFIDDYTKTITIVYKDNAGQIYILELDPAGTIVSATQPEAVDDHGVHRLVISPKGDYLTIE